MMTNECKTGQSKGVKKKKKKKKKKKAKFAIHSQEQSIHATDRWLRTLPTQRRRRAAAFSPRL
jgi:hypothetical protein